MKSIHNKHSQVRKTIIALLLGISCISCEFLFLILIDFVVAWLMHMPAVNGLSGYIITIALVVLFISSMIGLYKMTKH